MLYTICTYLKRSLEARGQTQANLSEECYVNCVVQNYIVIIYIYMASPANLPGKRTNYSARRTMITTLRHENVNPLDISQLSGHKNLKSIDSYSTVSEEQQKKMSFMISKRSSGREAMKPLCNVSQSQSCPILTSSTSQIASTCFAGAVFNNCSIVLSSKSPDPTVKPPLKRFRRVIQFDDDDD